MCRTKSVFHPLLGCLNVQAEARLACIPATRCWSWEQDEEAAGGLEDEHVNLPWSQFSVDENLRCVLYMRT